MQQHNLTITARHQPVVLERLLQVTRYRGFNVVGMTMFPVSELDQLTIELSVVSDKSVDNLKNQLLKIIDIEQIKVEDQALQKFMA
ncbi:acetolactate synthase 2 small subunit [Thalassotalea sp. 42_200_T64]|nr:acetolactate synthase 2 small subunit [Thalassotalea sp. 42_200_T64]